MEQDRNWRDAKMPQWVKDSVQAELDQIALTAALSWPTEPKPEPVPFRWVDYDNLRGVAVPGTYWTPNGRSLKIRKRLEGETDKAWADWKHWLFQMEGSDGWSDSIQRGPLFATAHDAKLYTLWLHCEECAGRLMVLRRGLYQ